MSGIKLTDKEWKDLIFKFDTDKDGLVSALLKDSFLIFLDFHQRVQAAFDQY
jgi:hypothetical protein